MVVTDASEKKIIELGTDGKYRTRALHLGMS
jgi:hypothetical protein